MGNWGAGVSKGRRIVRSGEVGGEKERITPFASSRVLYTLRADLEVCQTRNVDGDRILLTKPRLARKLAVC